jgi:flagellar basal-body rod modification protein FlgD
MNGIQHHSVMGAGEGAASTVASSLGPHRSAKQVTAKDNSSNPQSGSAADNSDITADDFLTLLVSELKNQDPTQPTDPNAYIQQLVGVNSLQQLISINQGITSLDTDVDGAAPPAS